MSVLSFCLLFTRYHTEGFYTPHTARLIWYLVFYAHLWDNRLLFTLLRCWRVDPEGNILPVLMILIRYWHWYVIPDVVVRLPVTFYCVIFSVSTVWSMMMMLRARRSRNSDVILCDVEWVMIFVRKSLRTTVFPDYCDTYLNFTADMLTVAIVLHVAWWW